MHGDLKLWINLHCYLMTFCEENISDILHLEIDLMRNIKCMFGDHFN